MWNTEYAPLEIMGYINLDHGNTQILKYRIRSTLSYKFTYRLIITRAPNEKYKKKQS